MGIDQVEIDRVGIVSIPKNLKINNFLLIGLDMIGLNITGLEMIVNQSLYNTKTSYCRFFFLLKIYLK